MSVEILGDQKFIDTVILNLALQGLDPMLIQKPEKPIKKIPVEFIPSPKVELMDVTEISQVQAKP